MGGTRARPRSRGGGGPDGGPPAPAPAAADYPLQGHLLEHSMSVWNLTVFPCCFDSGNVEIAVFDEMILGFMYHEEIVC